MTGAHSHRAEELCAAGGSAMAADGSRTAATDTATITVLGDKDRTLGSESRARLGYLIGQSGIPDRRE